MPITSSADALAKSWERRARMLEPFMAQATREGTRIVYAESRKNLKEMIYDQPVPTLGDIAREEGIISFERTKGKGKIEIAGRKRKKAKAKLGRYITIDGKTFVVPLSKKDERKKAWKRTGNLRRSERMRIVSPYLGLITNDAGYAEARHYKRSRFPAPWRTQAIVTKRALVMRTYRAAIIRAMREGVIRNPF